MHGNISEAGRNARNAAAMDCRENLSRQDLAEPLWFAVLCRFLWGGNAPKELEYALARNGLERSDRTCRAWASGDSLPPSNIFVALWLDHAVGKRVEQYVKGDCDAPWCIADRRAMGVGYAAITEYHCRVEQSGSSPAS
jgi:hypothetical protein